MATPAELVRGNATQLAGYRATLERLITEQATSAGAGTITASQLADAPFPGNAPAFGALMVIIEAVPRLEAALRLAVTGHPGARRGGSDGNFLDALDAISNLAGGLDEDGEALAARILERLCNLARIIPDIDEAQRWRLIPRRPCPYCKCWAVKVLLDQNGNPTRYVECFSGPVIRNGATVRCADSNGMRPVATMGIDGLQWADGLTEPIPDLDAA